jgi:hypothetical protein
MMPHFGMTRMTTMLAVSRHFSHSGNLQQQQDILNVRTPAKQQFRLASWFQTESQIPAKAETLDELRRDQVQILRLSVSFGVERDNSRKAVWREPSLRFTMLRFGRR